MAPPIQKTKLFLPALRSGALERPRLMQQLDGLRLEGCRAALISAPAGSGKTTAAAQWLRRAGMPGAWLALDERDNTPARFFAYLIAALQTIVPHAGGEALALVDLPGADPDEMIALLVNDLVEAQPASFTLALDDLHAITNARLYQAIDRLIDAQPPQMRLLLLSRQDPPLRLAGRRGRGQLVELRQDDLRFSPAEAAVFLNERMGLRLTAAQAQALEARTEGWIAGLQMAALSLQQAPDAERFVQAFSGSHRFILDYLIEEVLAAQPPEVQRFLQATAIVERMCAGLCAALVETREPEAQRRLEQLAQANLFVIPLDDERRWFRYHHLFRDLLLARLQAESDRQADLGQRASAWFEAHDEPRLAVEHALKANDAERAAGLIERHLTAGWRSADLEFMLLVRRLPPAAITARPALSLHSAWLSVMFGQADQILPFVQAAELALDDPQRSPAPEDNAHRAFARTLRAYIDDLANRPVALDGALEPALAAIPESNTGMRNSVAVVIGTIHYMEGDFETAIRLFEDAQARDRRVGGATAEPITAMRMALALLAQGRLHEAERRLRLSEAYIQARGSRRYYISGAINLMLAAALLAQDRLDECAAELEIGLRRMDDWPMPQVRALGQALLARLRLARGDPGGAEVALAQADALQTAPFHAMFADPIEQTRLQLLIAKDDRPALQAWAADTEQRLSAALTAPEPAFRYEARLVELGRAWLRLGRAAEAAALLERLAAAAAERAGSRAMILALLAAGAADDPARRLAALDEALRLAAPENHLCPFLDAGAALRPALAAWLKPPQAADAGRDQVDGRREFAQRIWNALTVSDSPFSAQSAAVLPSLRAKPSTTHKAPVEPLSRRELEVLRLMAAGLTNPQIAAQLVIAVRTVKKHVENIHGKLGAQNRTQAAALARELGLLE